MATRLSFVCTIKRLAKILVLQGTFYTHISYSLTQMHGNERSFSQLHLQIPIFWVIRSRFIRWSETSTLNVAVWRDRITLKKYRFRILMLIWPRKPSVAAFTYVWSGRVSGVVRERRGCERHCVTKRISTRRCFGMWPNGERGTWTDYF